MKRSAYNILTIIDKIHAKTGEYPGKKKLQKLVYLIEEMGGVDFNYEYDIHFYGVYSEDVDNHLTKLLAEYFVFVKFYKQSHLICISDEGRQIWKEDAEADRFFINDLKDDEIEKIDHIIGEFAEKSPLELELLTTVHYAASLLEEKEDRTDDAVLQLVKKIKGDKFEDDDILRDILYINKHQ